MLLLVMRLMGASEADTIYVGDSDVDILTAHNASLSCVSEFPGWKVNYSVIEWPSIEERISSHFSCLTG